MLLKILDLVIHSRRFTIWSFTYRHKDILEHLAATLKGIFLYLAVHFTCTTSSIFGPQKGHFGLSPPTEQLFSFHWSVILFNYMILVVVGFAQLLLAGLPVKHSFACSTSVVLVLVNGQRSTGNGLGHGHSLLAGLPTM